LPNGLIRKILSTTISLIWQRGRQDSHFTIRILIRGQRAAASGNVSHPRLDSDRAQRLSPTNVRNAISFPEAANPRALISLISAYISLFESLGNSAATD
jgi:hypothetical protein